MPIENVIEKLTEAVEKNSLRQLYELLDNGVSANTYVTNRYSDDEIPLLAHMLNENRIDMARFMLNNAKDLKLNLKAKTKNYRNTIIHFAMWARITDRVLLQKLIDGGCSADYGNKNGITPLMCACDMGDFDNVEFLIKLGADPYRACNWNLTSFGFAKGPDKEKIIRFMEKHKVTE
jgi:ankyrin repeat protein